jgi:hypothetical protein
LGVERAHFGITGWRALYPGGQTLRRQASFCCAGEQYRDEVSGLRGIPALAIGK